MARAQFAAELSAARAVRRWLRDQLSSPALPAPVQERVELLTTELVTNAVRHGSGPVAVECDVRARAGGRAVRVAVADTSDARPQLRHVAPEATGGRGVALVDALSARWGVERAGTHGKVVWFELDLPG
ncbi:ATP-binding protein [Kineococcus sp. SYSU DK004]|uniref:ATP-binding protein n=1 Tax=Kineococcus sp. SYSU DK004 TaxID=3383125 RepID=UPI003D7CF6B8